MIAESPKISFKDFRNPLIKKFWADRAESYPFQLKAPTGKPAPNKVKDLSPFICAPIGDGYSMWGFKNEVDADLFYDRYLKGN